MRTYPIRQARVATAQRQSSQIGGDNYTPRPLMLAMLQVVKPEIGGRIYDGATAAKIGSNARCDTKQQAFLDFVLAHYVSKGVQELNQDKLTPLLRLKYKNSIADAVADLGRPEEIGKVLAGFQQYLYQAAA